MYSYYRPVKHVARRTVLCVTHTCYPHNSFLGSYNGLHVFYIHAYIYTYIPWIHKCVTKKIGCATSHKYTNIYNFTVENTINVLQNSIIDHLYT
jgi:hypothetical protein